MGSNISGHQDLGQKRNFSVSRNFPEHKTIDSKKVFPVFLFFLLVKLAFRTKELFLDSLMAGLDFFTRMCIYQLFIVPVVPRAIFGAKK